MLPEHTCVYNVKAEDRAESRIGDLTAIEVTPKMQCDQGHDQPRRSDRVRVPVKRILTTQHAAAGDLPPVAVRIAQELVKANGPSVRWESRQRTLLRDWSLTQVTQGLHALVARGLIEVEERHHPNWTTHTVTVRDPAGVSEVARPGRLALEADARMRVATLPPGTPGAAEVLARLDGGRRLDDAAITWALRVIEHGAAGHKSMVRQFSGGHAGTKDFSRVKGTLETLLGSLESYGIIDPEIRLLLHGSATLTWTWDVMRLHPELGGISFPLYALGAVTRVSTRHLFLVENREILEACANGRIMVPEGCMVMETGGRPGPSVLGIVRATTCGVSVWADLDAAGIRTAAAVIEAAGGRGRALNMEPRWLDQANKNTTPETLEDARRLQDLPGDLGALARRIVQDKRWLEQEPQSRSIQALTGPPD